MTTILTDIEGTTTPIAFVRDTLFPYARARLPDLVRAHDARPEVAAELRAVAELAPGRDLLDTLIGWMDSDAKATPLKSLQGIIWRDGYLAGDIRGALYPDVAPAMRQWTEAGHRVAIYSSGSVEAQQLLFRYSDAGDLSNLIAAYFDTRIGAKRDPDSYRRIADISRTGDMLFLSDVEAELDAAVEAGLRTCQLVRPTDGTRASMRHTHCFQFGGIQV